jgi:coenzyme F420 hydrogenase subunit delta
LHKIYIKNKFKTKREIKLIQEMVNKPVLILGCGNILFGDDGFGPGAIAYLETHYRLPETVSAQDIGTGIREVLFDLLLAPTKPKRIFILDTICRSGKKAGEFFEIDPAEIGGGTMEGRPFHQFPSLGQLHECEALTGVDIRVVAVQAKELPESVRPGLSPEVQGAIPQVCDWLIQEIGSDLSDLPI